VYLLSDFSIGYLALVESQRYFMVHTNGGLNQVHAAVSTTPSAHAFLSLSHLIRSVGIVFVRILFLNLYTS
jgi:hypothetical protein